MRSSSRCAALLRTIPSVPAETARGSTSQAGFELQGGGADISGDIYLSGTSYPLQVSRLISQTSRQYEVSLADSFKSGGVVVKPDGSELSSVTAYLKNFYTSKSGSILGEDGKNIVLQSIVFLDGTKTASGDGSTPDKAFNNFAAVRLP